MTTIITKKGKGTPASDNLDVAELAIDIETGSLYTKLENLSVHEITAGDGSGGTGSSVHIGDTPPANPQEGQQWMEVPADGDATMWIYDGANWLQQPGGKDGADGTNGVDGLWTDNGGNSISYDGDVVIGSGSGGSSHPYTDLLLESNNHAAIQISTPSGKEQALWFSDEDATAAGGIAYNHLNDEMAFRINDDVRMTIDADGNVGINANSETPLTIGKTGTTALWEWDLQAGAVDSIRLSAKNPSGGYYAQDALVVDSGGTVTVNERLNCQKFCYEFPGDSNSGGGILFSSTDEIRPTNGQSALSNNVLNLGTDKYRFREGHFGTAIYVNGSPRIGYSELIEALSTLRNATMDETQDIRESLRSAIDELVAGFEQEIAAMPAGDSE
jgi:hypothetical protein